MIDEEESALTWEFIDTKHTLLLNHVYDHNKIGNLEYAQMIEENSGKESIELDYSDDEADSWTDDQKNWIDKWDVGTYDGDDISKSIIEKIQDADDGETIESITLEKNRVYIGKYNVDGDDYPVAVYSRKDKLDDLKKIKDDDLSYIIEEEKNHYIYYDENFADYFIIAFYEEGDATPSLIIQVEQIDNIYLENSMEKWLEFLGILKNEDNTPVNFEISLFEDDNQVTENSNTFITREPSMPNLKAQVSSDKYNELDVKFVIKYQRQCSGNGVNRSPDQNTAFPADGWHDLKVGEEWDIDFGMDAETNRPKIRGGIAYLIAKSPAGNKDTLSFFIKGRNPTVQQVNTYLNQAPYNQVWFFKKIIFHETGIPDDLTAHANQFNVYNEDYEDLSEKNWDAWSRMPCFGPECGWGLAQLDNPAPSDQTLWDWKANIQEAYELLGNKRRILENNHLDDCYDIIDGMENPENIIVIDEHTEGGITYTHSRSEHFDHDIDEHFGDLPTGDNRSLIDACWIKTYNGVPQNHFYYLVEGNLSEGIPTQWYIDNQATYETENGESTNYYVRDIGETDTP